jgi:hypothetical protein
MRVLFVMNTPGFLRYYDETVEALLEHGHEVVLGFTDARLRPEALDLLADRPRRPGIAGQLPARADGWMAVAAPLRALIDFGRYLDPRFARATWLRDRRRTKLLQYERLARLVGDRDTLPAPLVKALMVAGLRCEAAIPSDPAIEAVLREHRPDVVLISPLVTGASPQTDYVKAARALGLPCGVCIASWDNLTNKGIVRVVPDRLFVWNEAQREEAVSLHRVPAERIAVTGAQPFDRWFGRAPTASRQEFCARVGLDPERPFVLFVGSTSNITDSGAEDAFVRRWAAALRASNEPALAGVGALVRPHPDRRGAWTTAEQAGPSAIVWPPERPNSVLPAARGEYFDSLYHAAAIVGINTSAMVEGAIIGRPVLTVRLPEFEQSQEGTLHFAHLLPDNGGPLFVAESLEAHASQLAMLLDDPAPAHERDRRFAETFIRPHGLNAPATAVLVAGIEALADVRVRVRRARPDDWLLRAALRGVALSAARKQRRQDPPREDLERARTRTRRVSGALNAAAGRVERLAPPAARGLRAADARLWARDKRRRAAFKGQLRENKAERAQRREQIQDLKRRSGVKD